MRRGPRFSITAKVVLLVGVSALLTAVVVWLGTKEGVGPVYTLPFAVAIAILIALAFSSSIVDPLREAIRAAAAMADGDYSVRVRADTNDEVGQLAEAFNQMASDLAEVDRLHREIVANVSHELRTPLAALRSRLENMADGVEPATPENLEAALVQSERMTDLLQYLLDLSRVQAGVAGLEMVEVAVAQLVEDSIEVTQLASKQRGLDVNFSAHIEPLDLTLSGDPTRLQQVLVNVLDNAARHTVPGTTVNVDARAAKGNVRIEVTDRGAGISEEDRERVFGRFQRGSATLGPSTGGTGIGLAIAKWATSIHGGSIEAVDSEVGARFRILLPIAGPGGEHKRRRTDS